jgi:predicted RNA-binding Zn ribbon-like protein
VDEDWVFDGGRPCLDLVNTLRDRYTVPREMLVSPAGLARWLVAAGLADNRVRPGERDLQATRELREAIDRVLRAVAEGSRPTQADVKLLNEYANAAHLPAPQLRFDSEGRPALKTRRPEKPIDAILAALAVDAINLAVELPVIRICAAHDCGLRFLDSSPKRNRQWCSMARCGNRAKARNHYAKTKLPQGH